MYNNRGFTLLELMITIAIIGIVAIGAIGSGMGGFRQAKTAQNTSKELRDYLALLRNHATSRSTTARMVITLAGTTYTMTLLSSNVPTTVCSPAGAWTVIETKDIEVHSNYNMTQGTICFFRDGSSTGEDFIIAPNVGIDGKTYTLDTTIATGFIDVTEN